MNNFPDVLNFSYEEALILRDMLDKMEPHAFTDDENWIMIRVSDFISDFEDTLQQNEPALYICDPEKNIECTKESCGDCYCTTHPEFAKYSKVIR